MPAPSGAFLRPTSLPDAVAALRDLGPQGEVLSAGTWTMRRPLRGGSLDRAYVCIDRIPQLQRVAHDVEGLTVGAGLSHDRLAAALSGRAGCAALAQAAAQSGTPAIRAAATLGGNVGACVDGFRSADLTTALIGAGAHLMIAAGSSQEPVPIEDFLRHDADRMARGSLIVEVRVRPGRAKSSHQRLTLKRAGDYPVAILNLHVTASGGRTERARVAIGAVEAMPRRWLALEDALIGCPLDGTRFAEIAEGLLPTLAPRDGIDAPGWYRARVLPELLRRAVNDLR